MKLILYVVSVLSCFFATNVEGFKPRVNGGAVAPAGEFKYVVAIVIKKTKYFGFGGSSESLCGGGIIHERFILTAAHCFSKETKKNADGTYQRKFDKPSSVTVYAGTHSLKKLGQAIEGKGKKVYFKPDYFEDVGAADIAVLELKKNLDFSKYGKHLQMLQLPQPDRSKNYNMYMNDVALLAGFGDDYQGSKDTKDALKEVFVRVVNHRICMKAYGSKLVTHSGIICGQAVHLRNERDKTGEFVRPEKKLGPCAGDSGSPLVYHGNTVIGIMKLNSDGCDDRDDNPGVYVRVSKHVKFIEDVKKQDIRKGEVLDFDL